MNARQGFAILAVASIGLSFAYGRVDLAVYGEWDLKAYRQMAEAAPALASGIPQPFAFRVLAPFLAGMLPFELDRAFLVLARCLHPILLLLFYGFLIRRGNRPATALVVTLAFGLNKYLFGLTAWNYFQLCDVLSLIGLLGLFWAMETDRWLFFGIFMLASSLVRETSVLMLPVAVCFAWEKGLPMQRWLAMLAGSTAGVAILVFLRLVVPAEGGHSLFEAFAEHSPKLLSPAALYRQLINAFIPFSLLPLILYRETFSYFRQRRYLLLFFLGVFAATLFGSNMERLMAPAFIVFYPLMAALIDHLPAQWRRRVLASALALGFVAMFHHIYGVWPLPHRNVSVALSLLTLAGFSGVAGLAAIASQRREA